MKGKFEKGLKLMLPGEEQFDEFRSVVKFASALGYDFIMLELGGAMEYKSHPEINEGWIEYASFMNEYPGKTLEIQNAQRWSKNSIHTENGGGKVLTQKQIAQLIEICHSAGMEVVPEVPSLSHSDYLLTRHPEFAERSEDRLPDTACPSNEEYYKMLWDILEEIIALFKPVRMNIGHDECYSICLCPKCRGKVPYELYAQDINRMADFLLAHGVRPLIWGEKMLDAHMLDGEACGGAEIPETSDHEGRAALYPCGELLDKRIGIMHWYWSIDRNIEQRYEQLGREYWFGNFSLQLMPEATRRLNAAGCRGMMVSNWGRTDLITMQRNGVLYDLVYIALATDGKHNPDDFEELDLLTREQLYQIFLPEGEYFEVVHTTHSNLKFEYFFDGRYYQESNYLMGHHIFSDDAGNTYRFPVIFGTNISNDTAKAGRYFDKSCNMDRFSQDQQLLEAAGKSFAFTGEDGRTYYKTAYLLPKTGLTLHYVRFAPASIFVPPVIVQTVIDR